MHQKGFVNIVLIAVIVILAGAGTYFALNQQTTSPVSIPTPTPNPTPTPSPTPNPKPTTSLSSIELKYRLEDKFGKATFCGPPVISNNYNDELLKRFPTVAAEKEEFTIILKHLSIANNGSWTDKEKIAIVNEYDRLAGISLEPSNGKYKFSIRSTSQDKGELIYEGLITQSGGITTTKQQSYFYGCPICLAGNTLIDTPSGSIPVKNLQVGMSVWTTNKVGQRISGTIIKTSKMPVPPTHKMVHLVLSDKRELFVSSGHPTIDGRTLGGVARGNLYDGGFVLSTERVPYSEGVTYDILPSGDTGFYWANGILIGSTLR